MIKSILMAQVFCNNNNEISSYEKIKKALAKMPLLQQPNMQPLFVVAIYIIATNFMCCYRISLPPTMICCISHLLPPTMIHYVSHLLPPTMIHCVSHLL